MQTSPQLGTRGGIRIRGAVLVIASLCLAGCTTGDFGEPRASLVGDNIHDWIGPEATGSIPSAFELTDDERQLRDLAYPFIEPPYDRRQWYSIAGEWGLANRGAGYDRYAYANRLIGDPARSPASRYARLIDDVRDDTTRLSQFFETGARVSDMDSKRIRSLTYIAQVSPGERTDAARRVRENDAIIRMVQRSLDRRVASYRFAMERLIIMVPSPQAIEAERAINELRARVAFYRDGAPLGRGVTGPLARTQEPAIISK